MVFSLNNLFILHNLSKKIYFYTFVESIKNQIQIIKINNILLDSPIGTIYSPFKELVFVFEKIYCNNNNNNKIKVTIILFKKRLIR